MLNYNIIGGSCPVINLAKARAASSQTLAFVLIRARNGWDILVSFHSLFDGVEYCSIPYLPFSTCNGGQSWMLQVRQIKQHHCIKPLTLRRIRDNRPASRLLHRCYHGRIYSKIVDLKGICHQPCSRSRPLETQAGGAEVRTMRFTNSGKLSSNVLTQTLYLGCLGTFSCQR